jgi:hypothetical protein
MIVIVKPPCSVCGRRDVPVVLCSPPKCDRCLDREWKERLAHLFDGVKAAIRDEVTTTTKR